MSHDTRIRSLLLLLLVFLLPGCATLAYQHMNNPTRETWQKPQEVITKLAIKPGSRVADLGAGVGSFTWHLAGAVGPQAPLHTYKGRF